MDTRTGHRKDVISILVLLVLLVLLAPPASAVTPTEVQITDEVYDINFPDSLYMAYGSRITELYNKTFTFTKSTGLFISGDIVYFKISAYDNNPNLDSRVYIEGNNLTLSDSPTWMQDNFYIYKLVPDYDTLENKTQITSYLISNLGGESLYITAYVKPGLSVLPDDYVQYPDDSLANIVGKTSGTGTRGLVSIAFDLIELMLIITVIVGLVILLIMLWKVFEWFVSKVRT